MKRRRTLLPVLLTGTALGMLGLSFAAIPLYRAFCAATGYGGTPNTSAEAAPGVAAGKAAHIMTVRFDAQTQPGMAWRFAPEQARVILPAGQEQVAFFSARNDAASAVTGIALYNVTPEKIGRYFHKTACFCFNRQTLLPGQTMEFPVSFWIDPAIATDPNTADVRTITLSYTFFRSLDDAARSGALAKAGPHAGADPGLLRLKPAT